MIQEAQNEYIAAFKDSVDGFLKRHTSLARVRQLRDQLPGYDRAIWTLMAEQGWLGIIVPEDAGGLGLGLAELAAVAESLAAGLPPEPLAAVSLATAVLVRCDDSESRSTLLARIVAGESLPALAWQEQPHVFDPLAIETHAERSGEHVRLTGTKRFIPGAECADGFIISAIGADGVGLYWVARDAAGLEIHDAPQVDGTRSTDLQLVDVAATACLASGKTAQSALSEGFNDGLVVAGAELLGTARKGFALTLDYLRTRVQFGKPIGSFQALQHRAVDCYVQIELAAAVLNEAVNTPSAERAALASRVKARCSEAALLVGRESIQMHGAMGYVDATDIGLYLKRSLVKAAWLGGARHHRQRFDTLSPAQASDRPQRDPSAANDALRALPPSTDWNSLSDEDFRILVRDFIETHYPDDLRYLPRRVRWHEVREWNIKLAERGWIAPGWPKEWGGMDLTPAKNLIFLDELERWGVGRSLDQGVRQLGPALMKYGSEEQRRYYLPKIISCEHVWCQGYSEPNAGSDLASVSTTATIEGDEIVINGQKTWTSMAVDSTHIYLLCRTDKTVKKQAGISFIVADMNTPGISINPIPNIARETEFYEVFFDNVRVPRENLIGDLNSGWSVAKSVLDFERLSIGSPRRPLIAIDRMMFIAHKLQIIDNPVFRDQFAKLRLDLLDNATLFKRFLLAASAGTLGPEVSILKIWGMESFQRLAEATLEWAGSYGTFDTPIIDDEEDTNLYTPYYMSRMITIGGGSSEILRNLLARQILGLPV